MDEKEIILIVDDNATFREQLEDFLASEPDIEVIGEAANGEEAILKARELQPDLVLMDVRMPGINGLSATRQLKDETPELKVLMLSLFDIDEYRKAALDSGASGYVVKKNLVQELIPAIRAVFGESLPQPDHRPAAGHPAGGCGGLSSYKQE